jgi:hypothetical protein
MGAMNCAPTPHFLLPHEFVEVHNAASFRSNAIRSDELRQGVDVQLTRTGSYDNVVSINSWSHIDDI